MKFGTLQQILDPITVTWPKIEIFKIQDAAILKIVESPYLSESIIRFWHHLVYYSRYWTWSDLEKHYRSILDVIR